MAERFRELFRLQPKLYIEGSPVLIEAGALQKDSSNDKVLAQLKLRNISLKKIIACKVAIRTFEPNGTEIEGINSFAYLDLSICTGADFGSKTPIYLPDSNTRRFIVAVTEVVFDDNTVWIGKSDEWYPVPDQRTLNEEFNDLEMARQYEIEVGNDSSFVPLISGGLFICTCGAVNLESNQRCYRCNRKYENLVEWLDETKLQEKKEARLKKEIEDAEEIERKRRVNETAKRRRKKKLAIIFSVLFVVCIAMLTSLFIVTRNKQTNELLYTIETSFYNRVYINAEMDEEKKLDIQIEELETFKENHQLILVEKPLMNKYENLIDLLYEQKDVLQKLEDVQIGLEFETCKMNHMKSMSEVADSFIFIVDNYDICSKNQELADRFRVNQVFFHDQYQAWEYITNISKDERKAILNNKSLEFVNSWNYDIELYLLFLDSTGDYINGEVDLVVKAGEKSTISKPANIGTSGNGDIVIIMDMIDPR